MSATNSAFDIMKEPKKAITLVELLIAISLMAAIILGAASFDLASRRFLKSSEEGSALLNELGLILEHMSRNIARATGDVNDPGITWDAAKGILAVRVDDANAPGDYSKHTVLKYVFSGRQITFQGQPLTKWLDAMPNIAIVDGGVRISGLRLRNDNGRVVSIEDAASPPNDTIYFFPLSHSWN